MQSLVAPRSATNTVLTVDDSDGQRDPTPGARLAACSGTVPPDSAPSPTDAPRRTVIASKRVPL